MSDTPSDVAGTLRKPKALSCGNASLFDNVMVIFGGEWNAGAEQIVPTSDHI
ncbi:hypothetical protein GCM10014713_56640 [Streptomyces purpureus]|uniref:Uncharacterized protein n=1 Tax=Streptomyces purpureus TaxID=1951 RepID=A0A918HDK1_9ACTN|nr:hypothetical protein GCM10014713_56640 [Streptomyces purpureus]